MKYSQSGFRRGVFFAVILICQLFGYPSSALENGAVKKFQKLRELPMGAAPFSTVGPLVNALVRQKPLRAFTYYRIGFERLLKTSQGTLFLTHQTLVEIRKSDLPQIQKERIVKRVGLYLYRYELSNY
jgi:hypothetical protein